MTWAERQRIGEIDGVELKITSITTIAGRRSEVLVFPGRDTPGWQDHGRAPRQYRISAVLAGDDYDRDLLDLVAIAESPGDHVFTHPTLGEGRDGEPLRWLVDGPITIDEDQDELGSARVSFSVKEAGEDQGLRATTSTPAGLKIAAAQATIAAGASLFAAWDVSEGGSDWSRAIAAIGSAITRARIAAAKVTAAIGVVNTINRTIDEVEDLASDLAGAPLDLAAGIAGIFSGIGNVVRVADLEDDDDAITADTAGRALALVRATVDAAAWRPGDELDGPTTDAQAANDIALAVAFAAAAIAGASEALAEIELDSADTAAAALDGLSDAVGDLLELEGIGDDAYAALVDLRTAVDDHLRREAQRLPSLTTYTTSEDEPAILLAWRLSGDAGGDLDLLARNPTIGDPNAVPGGSEVVILV